MLDHVRLSVLSTVYVCVCVCVCARARQFGLICLTESHEVLWGQEPVCQNLMFVCTPGRQHDCILDIIYCIPLL